MSNDTKPTRARKAVAALTATPRARASTRRTAAKAETVPLAALEGEVVASSTTAASKRPTVEWRGRDLPVKMLSGEQIMSLTMTLDQLGKAADEEDAQAEGDADSPEARAGWERRQRRIRRVLDIILSVLADEDDREWVLDLFAADRLKLNDVMDLVPRAIRATNEDQRPAAPTTGPVSKARRR